MPIRTHRGRAAVYRKLWGWPLRSPWHLAGAALGLVLVAAGVGVALPEGSGGIPDYRSAQSTSATLAPGATGGPQDVSPLAMATARAWVDAFVDTPEGITSQAWREGLRPHSTERLLAELGQVDPANVPEAERAGPGRAVAAGAETAEVDIPTTAMVLRIRLVDTVSGWRVASYERDG